MLQYQPLSLSRHWLLDEMLKGELIISVRFRMFISSDQNRRLEELITATGHFRQGMLETYSMINEIIHRV